MLGSATDQMLPGGATMTNDNAETIFPDREAELGILKKLKAVYPEQVDVQNWYDEFPGLAQEVRYLHEHGLVEARFSESLEAGYDPVLAAITKDGIDLLADDGGLSAILGVVTIRLHDDTLKALIESKILQSDLPQPDKKRCVDALRELPAETTKHLLLKLVDIGLASGPAAIAAISKFLGGS